MDLTVDVEGAHEYLRRFVYEGGEYRIVYQAFILPLLLIANSVRALASRSGSPAS